MCRLGVVDSGGGYILFLSSAAEVVSHQRFTAPSSGFTATAQENIGHSCASPGDLNGDGRSDALIGAIVDSGAYDSVFLLFLNQHGQTLSFLRLGNNGIGGFTGTIAQGDEFSYGVGSAADVDGDSVPDFVVGARFKDSRRGFAYVIFSNAENGSSPSIICLSLNLMFIFLSNYFNKHSFFST